MLQQTGGTYVKLWGNRPRLATVTAEGSIVRQAELGARRPSPVRALACGRGDRLAAAWTDDTRLMLSFDGERARTIATAEALYDEPPIGDIALAFRPDGSLLVAYAVFQEVRAVRVTDGRAGRPFKLGPAFEVTDVAAERDVVAWTTIDAGEERNERRRVYAVRGSGKPELVHRAPRVINAMTGLPGTALHLSVAPNGRAALLFGRERSEFGEDCTVWSAEASPGHRFRTARRLSGDGVPGDIAIRSDGDTLAVFHEGDALRTGDGETITEKVSAPVARFHEGRPRVEWRGGSSERR